MLGVRKFLLSVVLSILHFVMIYPMNVQVDLPVLYLCCYNINHFTLFCFLAIGFSSCRNASTFFEHIMSLYFNFYATKSQKKYFHSRLKSLKYTVYTSYFHCCYYSVIMTSSAAVQDVCEH